MQSNKVDGSVYVFTIEVRSSQWDFAVGQRVKVLVIAKGKDSAIKIFEDNYTGGAYPEYELKEVEEIKDHFLFPPSIQKSVFR